MCLAGEYLNDSDTDHAEQERSVSIAAMDVSDFEGGEAQDGDDEHDDGAEPSAGGPTAAAMGGR